jgi:hypothetical protein
MPGKGDPNDPSQPQPQPKRDKSQDPNELQKQSDAQEKPEKSDPRDANEPKPKEGDPKSGKPDSRRPEQKNSDRPPPKGETGEFQRADVTGRWGVLPPKEAEDLQRRDAEEFPERYRRWMELYFNRVNRLQARDR